MDVIRDSASSQEYNWKAMLLFEKHQSDNSSVNELRS